MSANVHFLPKGDYYAPIDSATVDNVVSEAKKSSSSDFSLHSLFTASPEANTNNAVTSATKARSVFASRLQGKVTMLENNGKDLSQREQERVDRRVKREGRQGKRQRKKTLTRKEKTALGDLAPLRSKGLKYAMFVPLYRLWLEYMDELFAGCSDMASESALMRIVKADFHGSVFTVVASKCKEYIGISGIMIKESDGMFNIITRENRVMAVPKSHSNFAFKFREKLYTLYGSHLKGSAADRVAKKIRAKNTVEIV